MSQIEEQPPQYNLLLDKDWERQQILSFTQWINFQLKRVGLKINDITTDLSDGKIFMRLLEVISNESLPPPERKNQRVHHISNVNKCLDFITRHNVKLVGTSAEEIVDHNLKMILGCIWVVILRFSIQEVDSSNKRDGLLLWVKNKTSPYKNVNVQNWTSSFQDGLAFNALIHCHRPDLIDYEKLKRDNALDNLNNAFDVAETQLGIPRMLSAEDMISMPDPKSVMTYISAFYQTFGRSQFAENAARKIRRMLDANSKNQVDIEKYQRLTSDLLEWVRQKSAEFGDTSFEDKDLEQILQEIKDMNRYRQEEKPPKAKEKATIENLASTIRTRLYLQKRPDFVPISGHSLSDIKKAWDDLSSIENIRLERLHMIVQKLKIIEHIMKKFMYKCKQQDLWISDRTDPISVNVSQMSLSEIGTTKRALAALGADLETREPRMRLISGLYDKLKELSPPYMSEVDSRYQQVSQSWDELKALHAKVIKEADERERALLEIEKLMLEYAQKASEVKGDLDVAFEDLNDTYQVNSLEELQVLLNELSTLSQSVSDNETKIQECQRLEDELSKLSATKNIYCSLTCGDLNERLSQVKESIESRRSDLDAEGSTQKLNESLCKKFASLASEVDDFHNVIIRRVQEVPDQVSSLEEHLSSLKVISDDFDSFYRSKIPQIEELSVKLRENSVFHNPLTSHTQESLDADYHALFDLMSSSITEVENQVILRDSSSITEKQVKEWRKAFDYCDKEKIGSLDYVAFRDFLVALEFAVEDETSGSSGDLEFRRIISKVDTQGAGRVYFNDFLNFMAIEAKDADTADQVIDSFRALAGGKDYITPELIKQHIPDRADEIISRMVPSTVSGAPPGALDFASFASAIYGESDL